MSDKRTAFDRTITLGLVFTVALQTASALLWAGAAEARIASLEMRHVNIPPVFERLARIEEQMVMTRRSLSRIETRIEARADKPEP